MVTEPSDAHFTSSLVIASKVIFTAVAPGKSTMVYWSREFSYGCWVHARSSKWIQRRMRWARVRKGRLAGS